MKQIKQNLPIQAPPVLRVVSPGTISPSDGVEASQLMDMLDEDDDLL